MKPETQDDSRSGRAGLRAALSASAAAFFAAALCAPVPAAADIVPGLEAYGDLSLVDEVICATDVEHEFHDYPEGASYATNILGSACRVLAHPSGVDGFLSWRLGKGKDLEPHAMYLLVAEYPEDVPRTATLINKATNSRNGFHTGWTVGQSTSGGVLAQIHLESVDVPLSGAWERVEELMVLNEKAYPLDKADRDSDSCLVDVVANGFDAVFQVFRADHAPDSAGAAIRAVRLYRVNDEANVASAFRYPAGNAPRRLATWREEMGNGFTWASNADPADGSRHKARLMKALGLNCFSRTMLEWGYNKNWDAGWKDASAPFWNPDWGGGSSWSLSGSNTDYWSGDVDAFYEAGLYLMPYYEYSGSRGSWGPYEDGNGNAGKALGFSPARKAVTLFEDTGINPATHFNNYVQASNGASGSNVDLTQEPAYDDFKRILACTMLRYAGRSNFAGAWIRNRGSMPVSFSDAALASFCEDTGREAGSVTRQTIIDSLGGGDAWINTAKWGTNRWSSLYREYREWWYGKRADWLEAMQDYLADNGIPGAKVLFTGSPGEVGPTLHLANGKSDDHQAGGVTAVARLGNAWNFKGTTSIPGYAELWRDGGLFADGWSWYAMEYQHSEPHPDPETYGTRRDVAVGYPYDGIASAIAGGPNFGVPSFRNASGDLFFNRFYCLQEGQHKDSSGNENIGYFTCDMDHAGRAIVAPELWGVLYQDPTIIGMLQGDQFARAFSRPFREFMENFLALPAKAGTFTQGNNWWGSSFGVRKYAGDGETLWAVVNASWNALPATEISLGGVSSATVYEAVSGRAHAVSGDKVTLDLQPYQLLALTTTAPDEPRFSIAVPDVGSDSAVVPLDVSTLGGDAADLTVSFSTSPDMAGATTLSVAALAAAGTNEVVLAGLAPNTVYYAEFGLTNALSRGAARRLSFTTDVPATYPRGSFSVSAGVNEATVSATFDTLGSGASSCAVSALFEPLDPRLSSVEVALGTATEAGAFAGTAGPLSSEAAYTVTLFADNGLTDGPVAVGKSATVVTARKPAPAAGAARAYAPGLLQGKLVDAGNPYNATDPAAKDPAAQVVPGTIMAYTDGTAELSDGRSWSWGDNTTFVYEGQMWMTAGVDYHFGKLFDDFGYAKVDGTVLVNDTQYNRAVRGTVRPSYTGWHDVLFRVGNGGGGVGPREGSIGFAFNTNGVTGVNASTFVAPTWEKLLDSGDGKLLRWPSDSPVLVSVAGTPVRSAGALVVPVAVDSYDEDNELSVCVVSASEAGDRFSEAVFAPGDFSGWTVATGETPAVGLAQNFNVPVPGLSFAAGDTLTIVARLRNERTGYDVASAAATYVVPADETSPEFVATLSEAGYHDAAFHVFLGSLGLGASSASITIAVSGGAPIEVAADVATYDGTVRIPATLPFDTEAVAVVTVVNDLGKSAKETLRFKTLASTPPVAAISLDSPGYTDADASVSVTDLGAGCVSATVEWSLSPGGLSGTAELSGPGAVPVALSGLDLGTAYELVAVVTADSGLSTTLRKSFETLPGPFALGDTFVEVAADGKSATVGVEIEKMSEPCLLTLYVNGESRMVWPFQDPVQGLTVSISVPAAVGRTDEYEFRLASSRLGEVVTASASGSWLGRKIVDWFTVAFDEQGYAQGEGWSDVPASYGTWASSGNVSARLSVVSGETAVAYSTAEESAPGTVSYSPTSASPEGTSVRIEGRAMFQSGTIPAPDPAAVAGLVAESGRSGLVFSGLANGQWHELSGITGASEDAFHDWAAEIALADGESTVTYFVDGSRLSPTLSLGEDPAGVSVSRVAYVGAGVFSDFRGILYVTTPEGRTYYEVSVSRDPGALSFKNAGSAGEAFCVAVANPVAGRWYTAFAASEVDGEFVAAASALAADGGELAVEVPTGSEPALFVRIVCSDEEIPAGTRFSELVAE
ncbi:MAG: hypothetical protein IJ678_06210 [Kiritimatiellae bacterium]|nr:hypothetical protein [Kiritimatiellia bacterium]